MRADRTAFEMLETMCPATSLLQARRRAPALERPVSLLLSLVKAGSHTVGSRDPTGSVPGKGGKKGFQGELVVTAA